MGGLEVNRLCHCWITLSGLSASVKTANTAPPRHWLTEVVKRNYNH